MTERENIKSRLMSTGASEEGAELMIEKLIAEFLNMDEEIIKRYGKVSHSDNVFLHGYEQGRKDAFEQAERIGRKALENP